MYANRVPLKRIDLCNKVVIHLALEFQGQVRQSAGKSSRLMENSSRILMSYAGWTNSFQLIRLIKS
jgi:hypothetical protein